MDTAVIFALVLSAIFMGCILWLIIYSRLHKDDAAPVRQAETPAVKDVPGRRTARRD